MSSEDNTGKAPRAPRAAASRYRKPPAPRRVSFAAQGPVTEIHDDDGGAGGSSSAPGAGGRGGSAPRAARAANDRRHAALFPGTGAPVTMPGDDLAAIARIIERALPAYSSRAVQLARLHEGIQEIVRVCLILDPSCVAKVQAEVAKANEEEEEEEEDDENDADSI